MQGKRPRGSPRDIWRLVNFRSYMGSTVILLNLLTKHFFLLLTIWRGYVTNNYEPREQVEHESPTKKLSTSHVLYDHLLATGEGYIQLSKKLGKVELLAKLVLPKT